MCSCFLILIDHLHFPGKLSCSIGQEQCCYTCLNLAFDVILDKFKHFEAGLTFWILLLCVGWGDVCYGGTLWLHSHRRQNPLELIMLLDFAPFHQSFSLKSTSHIFIFLLIFMTCKKHCMGFESCWNHSCIVFPCIIFLFKEDLGLLDMYVQVILFSNKSFEFNSIHDLGFPSQDLTLPLNICIEIPTPIAT